MDGWVRVLRPFNSISVISRRWKGEHERLCAMKCHLGSGRISPPAGFKPATPWSEVGSANRSATRTLLSIRNGFWSGFNMKIEPRHDKTNKMICAPSEDSDRPGYLPSLIRVSAVSLKQNCILSYPLSAHRRLWSDWVDAQADLNLHWAQKSFVGFVMRWLKMLLLRVCICSTYTFHHIFYISHRTQYEII